jgi:hypothetical protein
MNLFILNNSPLPPRYRSNPFAWVKGKIDKEIKKQVELKETRRAIAPATARTLSPAGASL